MSQHILPVFRAFIDGKGDGARGSCHALALVLSSIEAPKSHLQRSRMGIPIRNGLRHRVKGLRQVRSLLQKA